MTSRTNRYKNFKLPLYIVYFYMYLVKNGNFYFHCHKVKVNMKAY